MLKNLKKTLLSLSIIILFALYALQHQTRNPGTSSVASNHVTSGIAAPFAPAHDKTPTVSGYADAPTAVPSATSSNSTIASSASGSGAPGSLARGAFRDGTYTGATADAYWGTVEVNAIISNGQLSDVQFVQYPNHRSRSQEINRQAMPMLTQEAIQSQRANVDVVTGATDTSDAFIQSLDSALQQAAS